MNTNKIITCFLLFLSLIACGKQYDSNYVTRVDYDTLITATNQKINQQTNAFTQYKKEAEDTIEALTKLKDIFEKDNIQLKSQIKTKTWLLDEKNDTDRRELELWGEKDWFWVYQCSEWHLTNLGFSVCQFTDSEIKRAREMIGKGYPFKPKVTFESLPGALIVLCVYFILIVFIFGVLLWSILTGISLLLPKPCKELLFEINSKYRAKVICSFKDANFPYEKAAYLEIEKKNEAQIATAKTQEICNQNQRILKEQNDMIYKNKRILEEDKIKQNISKIEGDKIVQHYIDFFVNLPNIREKFLKELKQHLNHPVGSKFPNFAGLAPTTETLKKIDASEFGKLLGP